MVTLCTSSTIVGEQVPRKGVVLSSGLEVKHQGARLGGEGTAFVDRRRPQTFHQALKVLDREPLQCELRAASRLIPSELHLSAENGLESSRMGLNIKIGYRRRFARVPHGPTKLCVGPAPSNTKFGPAPLLGPRQRKQRNRMAESEAFIVQKREQVGIRVCQGSPARGSAHRANSRDRLDNLGQTHAMLEQGANASGTFRRKGGNDPVQ